MEESFFRFDKAIEFYAYALCWDNKYKTQEKEKNHENEKKEKIKKERKKKREETSFSLTEKPRNIMHSNMTLENDQCGDSETIKFKWFYQKCAWI